VVKHHQKFGLKCDWITEVKTTAWKKSLFDIFFFDYHHMFNLWNAFD
jgi:hypothetical protein